jgi:hypothetical protein
MSLSVTQVDEAFAALGLQPPSPPVMTALTSVPNTYQAAYDLIALPEVQSIDAPIVEMFDVALGHEPTSATLSGLVESGLTRAGLAAAFVSSQTFANIYNGGALLNPNAPISAGVVDALFIAGLGHPPTAATEAGFAGLTNAQAFYEFVMSPTTVAANASTVTQSLYNIIDLASGLPSEASIVGSAVHHAV